MTNLALFDLDGTLIESTGFDADCYVAAVREVLGIDSVNTDWGRYLHATDAGILQEIYLDHFHEAIPEDIAQQVKDRFVDIILERFRKEHFRLRPLPGAAEAVHLLESGHDWRVAIATGGWKESAELKLMNAMLELERVPIFSANDAPTRTGIMGLAIRAMQESAGVKEFEKVVYVGDAPWDLRACREMGIPFLAVGARAGQLSEQGATRAIKDYADKELFLKYMNECEAPAPV